MNTVFFYRCVVQAAAVTILTLLAGGCEVKVFYQSAETVLKPINIPPGDQLKSVMTKLHTNTSLVNPFRCSELGLI